MNSNYFESIMTSDERCLVDIKTIIIIAQEVFCKMENIFTNIKLPTAMLKCYIEPIQLYTYEAWSREAVKHLMAAKLWFMREMERIWADRKTNKTVLQETGKS